MLAQQPAVQQPAVAPSPPPCWCGQSSKDHDYASKAGHDYAPAQGVESEAYDAW
ncbi:MAG TPA: hypothetical protein VFA46_05980 [Actinomycetes bacterium]|jgi:hypothetical protein|nr:hypothetical protein [Actinomycetes bacterium]